MKEIKEAIKIILSDDILYIVCIIAGLYGVLTKDTYSMIWGIFGLSMISAKNNLK